MRAKISIFPNRNSIIHKTLSSCPVLFVNIKTKCLLTGSYCPQNSSLAIPCAPGHYCPANATKENLCPLGYKEIDGSLRTTLEDTCEACTPGTYGAEADRQVCLKRNLCQWCYLTNCRLIRDLISENIGRHKHS